MRPRRVESQQEEVEGTGECILFDANGRVVGLNPTAAAVWDLIDGSRDAASIAAILAEAAGVEPAQTTGEVRQLLESLRDAGFVELD
jgi:hypothetical protein